MVKGTALLVPLGPGTACDIPDLLSESGLGVWLSAGGAIVNGTALLTPLGGGTGGIAVIVCLLNDEVWFEAYDGVCTGRRICQQT